MSFYTPLPRFPGHSGAERYLNIVDGKSTAVQRALRREGLAAYEPPTVAAILAVMELQEPGFTFFDVGANVGLYSSLCGALFDPGRVVAFEPTPKTAAIARKIARVNHLETDVEELALGSEVGTAELFLSAKSDASNSLVEGFKENVGTVEVEVSTLDRYVERSGSIPQIVKIDAETFEPAILQGSKETMARHRPALVVEVLHRHGRDHGIEIMEVMEGLGYHYYDISTYSEWKPSERISGDPQGEDRDWLLVASPLPADFRDRYEAWERAIEECTADRNSTAGPQSAETTTTQGWAAELRRVVAGVKRRLPASR